MRWPSSRRPRRRSGRTRRPGVDGVFRALHSKPFRLYFIGQVVSASGTFLQQTAIGWLVLRLTGSAASLGLVLAAGGVPSLVLGPWGGVVADRVNLRKLLIATQAAFGLLAGLLWALAAAGSASVAVLVAIGVAGGFVQIVDSPARQAFVSALVPPDDLASAVSLNGVVVNSARVVGPAVAGVLIVTVGTTPCFAVNALSYVAVIVALVAIRPIAASQVAKKGAGNLRAGIRYSAEPSAVVAPADDDGARRVVRVQLRRGDSGPRPSGLPRIGRDLRAHVDHAQRGVDRRLVQRRPDPPPSPALSGGGRARLRRVPGLAGGAHRTSPSPARRSCSPARRRSPS